MKDNINIFLDDIRYPNMCLSYMFANLGEDAYKYNTENWLIVRNYVEFKEAVENNLGYINLISFDHDLADAHYSTDFTDWINHSSEDLQVEETGLDCAKFLIQIYKKNNLELPKYWCHSMNPVGRQNILNALNDAKRT